MIQRNPFSKGKGFHLALPALKVKGTGASFLGEVGSGGAAATFVCPGLEGQAAGYPDVLSNGVQHPPFLKSGDHFVP